ncbi:MAG: hypothetical protein JOZ62_21635 [Acidobacteriaceae bacterium]|nr:hypothetical protein [Acidobacteriaceae bacterium]
MANNSTALRLQDFGKFAAQAHAFRLEPKSPPLYLPGIKSLLNSGLQRGIVAEVNGGRSSGRTSVCLHILAQATQTGEVCAVIDLYDTFAPGAAANAGVQLDRLVWVRCHGNIEHAMRAADLVLHAGGFGVVLLDLCEASPRALNRIPFSYWYRFRRAVEHTPAIFVVCADTPQAKSCSSASLFLTSKRFHWSGNPPFSLLRSIEVNATLGSAAAPPSSIQIRVA